VFPLLLIVYYAFTTPQGAFSFANFGKFFTDGTKINTLIISIVIWALNTLLCLLIGYPIAYILANKKYNSNKVIVMLFVMPMWINFVLRTAATRDLLSAIGIKGGNMPYVAVMIGMVYNYLPFVILPLYTTMLKMDKSVIEASSDLGAKPYQTFIKTIIPMSMPGIVSAATMVFMPTLSTFVISDLLGNNLVQLLGNIINLEFTQNSWNYGSALSIILLLLMGLTMFIEKKYNNKTQTAGGRIW